MSEHQPSLTRLDAPDPSALILMLHGGTSRSDQLVDSRSASWLRMAAMQRAITSGAHAAGASTWLLRYRVRGWNHGTGPVEDARWALEHARQELGDVPVVLLGHSMGGRTSVHVADAPQVTGVVGLAPWWSADDPVSHLDGRHLVAAHGRADRITSHRATASFVERARRTAASARLHDMGPIGHYMLRRIPTWNQVALDSSLALLPTVDRQA